MYLCSFPELDWTVTPPTELMCICQNSGVPHITHSWPFHQDIHTLLLHEDLQVIHGFLGVTGKILIPSQFSATLHSSRRYRGSDGNNNNLLCVFAFQVFTDCTCAHDLKAYLVTTSPVHIIITTLYRRVVEIEMNINSVLWPPLFYTLVRFGVIFLFWKLCHKPTPLVVFTC